MAISVCVAVFDKAVGAFGRPFFVPSSGAAVRAFLDECSRVEGEMFKHPVDYELFMLGTFDDLLGALVSVPAHPELLARGSSVVVREREVGHA